MVFFWCNGFHTFFSHFADFSEFGSKIFTLKPVVKVLPKLFDHSDKNVREEVNIVFYWHQELRPFFTTVLSKEFQL